MKSIITDENFNVNDDNYVGYIYEGKVFDFHEKIPAGLSIDLIPREHHFGQDIIRHSFAHIMAQALNNLYGPIEFGVGPTTDYGFYYDFICKKSISTDDFPRIESEMLNIIEANYPIIKSFHSKSEANNILQDSIKVEIMKNIDSDRVSIYSQGNYKDLCRGPHVLSTGYVGNAFKLTNISQIMWKKTIPMQRLEGIGFANIKLLLEYEANELVRQNNDHRILGKNMDLFSLSPLSPGMAFWHKNGLKLFRKIESYIRNLMEQDYEEVCTPPMYKLDLWKKTGHLDKYAHNMYIIHDELALKPMNCPAHTILFSQKSRSYKDLPLRISEFGRVFRNEDAGGVLGLKRARHFCQDDAHIFCSVEHLSSEITRLIKLIDVIYKHFGFTYWFHISTRPEKRIGSDELWDTAEEILINSAKSCGKTFKILPGEGAFYGPKIEIHILDNNNKPWQCGTIQVDFFIGERLNASYINENCEKTHPVVIHHALLGSLERFIAILLESGLPFTYHPYQFMILPISIKHLDYAQVVKNKLQDYNCHIVDKNCTLSEKIKQAYELKSWAIIIVGEKDRENNSVTLQIKDLKYNIPLDNILDFIKEKFISE